MLKINQYESTLKNDVEGKSKRRLTISADSWLYESSVLRAVGGRRHPSLTHLRYTILFNSNSTK
jgi:hypothetical protein